MKQKEGRAEKEALGNVCTDLMLFRVVLLINFLPRHHKRHFHSLIILYFNHSGKVFKILSHTKMKSAWEYKKNDLKLKQNTCMPAKPL